MAEPLHGHGPCQSVPETYFEFIASACCKVLHKRFQSKIEEENVTQLGWYHLCKNDYFSFFFRGFTLIIFLNLMLAFVEKPSSFT